MVRIHQPLEIPSFLAMFDDGWNGLPPLSSLLYYGCYRLRLSISLSNLSLRSVADVTRLPVHLEQAQFFCSAPPHRRVSHHDHSRKRKSFQGPTKGRGASLLRVCAYVYVCVCMFVEAAAGDSGMRDKRIARHREGGSFQAGRGYQRSTFGR